MHIAFLNPQGNFDPNDSYWTQHPDFGGQLVYVKQVALAMASLGHSVDILTRQIKDPAWPEFSTPESYYEETPQVRILRLPAGPDNFLHKEELWPHIIRDWVTRILALYRAEGRAPDAFTGHYADGGLAGVLIEAETAIPFTFTGHSLGAQKMDKLDISTENLAQMDAHYHFARRLVAERLSMNRSAVNITSTQQERYEQYGHRAYRDAVDVQDDRRFAVIPPGVNLDIFGKDATNPEETATQAHVCAMFERDLSEPRRSLPAIIASSRLDPKKNLLALVQGFAQTPELQKIANLVLITGAHNDPLRDDSKADPLEKRVLAEIRTVVEDHNLWGKISAFSLQGQPALAAAYRFLAKGGWRNRTEFSRVGGYRDCVGGYRDCVGGSVFALTALYEPFGLAPLEAAAAGLPLVVTKNGGPGESLRDGDTEYGVLVDPANSADIGRGLLRVINNRETWEGFAHRGRQRVLDRYTWQRTAEAYATLIEAVLVAPAARRTETLLPIHPYFQNGLEEHDITLDELRRIYQPEAQ